MRGHQMSGQLMKGFVGNISYEIVLPTDMDCVSIEVSFEKRTMENITEEDRQACIKTYKNNVALSIFQKIQFLVSFP